jgi:hypothetical protein
MRRVGRRPHPLDPFDQKISKTSHDVDQSRVTVVAAAM